LTTIAGSTTEFVGSSQFPCLDPSYAFGEGIAECGPLYSDPTALTLATVNFLEEHKGVTWDEPLFFNSNAYANQASFQFSTDQASPGSLDDNLSSFKGSVVTSNSQNKVTLQHMDLTPLAEIASSLDATNTFQYNENLFNRPASDLEFLQYDFFPVCNGIDNCHKQFYLNIYLRSDARDFGDTTVGAWRDCNLAYVPSTGPDGEWSTVKIDVNTPAQARDCPSNFSNLAEAQAAGYVLGTNLGLIYILNMGDTTDVDSGLEGYFDNIRLKLANEDVRIYDL
jgi:hypothetical protein